jgi:hypothetical protein
VDHRAGLDAVTKRRIYSPYRESNPGLPAHNLLIILTELSWLIRVAVWTWFWAFLVSYKRKYRTSLKSYAFDVKVYLYLEIF